MSLLHLITGGCRSGKSGYAQALAEQVPGRRVYVATAPVSDDEMRLRIAAHQAARRDRGWETIEEQVDLPGVLARQTEAAVVLVDCVTLWVNNLMYYAQQEGREVHETDVARQAADVLAAARRLPGTVLLVTNEVGLGVVPENALARRYRDLVGRANQILAAEAGRVTLLVCGIPVQVKGAAT